MHLIRFWLGLCPRSRWGSLERSPDLLAGFEGPTFRGGEGRGEEKGEERRYKVQGGEEKAGEGEGRGGTRDMERGRRGRGWVEFGRGR